MNFILFSEFEKKYSTEYESVLSKPYAIVAFSDLKKKFENFINDEVSLFKDSDIDASIIKKFILDVIKFEKDIKDIALSNSEDTNGTFNEIKTNLSKYKYKIPKRTLFLRR